MFPFTVLVHSSRWVSSVVYSIHVDSVRYTAVAIAQSSNGSFLNYNDYCSGCSDNADAKNSMYYFNLHGQSYELGAYGAIWHTARYLDDAHSIHTWRHSSSQPPTTALTTYTLTWSLYPA